MFPTHFVFNHFPKAGGTSFVAVCRHNIPRSQISSELMEQNIRLVRPERFEHYRFIFGHFGILSQMGFSRARYSITLVRNPISTILSTYNFWRTRPEDDPVTSQAKLLSFPDFVRRFAKSPTIINNTYTHHFAAMGRDYPGEPDNPELLLAVAKHNLAAFNFVGICEQFGETIRLLCADIGWQHPESIPHENRSVRAQSKENIDRETLNILHENNQLDLKLYEFAEEMFAERLRRAGGRQGESNGSSGVLAGPLTRDPNLPPPNRFLPFPMPEQVHRVAQVVSVSAEVSSNSSQSEFTITYQVSEIIPDLIAGVLLHDSEGNVIAGTSTMLEELVVPQEVSRSSQVKLKLHGQLAPGTYSVSAALARSDRPGFHYDWVDRALLFRIDPPPRTVESRMEKLAHKALRPISKRFFARLETHLQPIESRLGMVQAVTSNVRDRVASLHESVVALRAEQTELRKQLAQLSQQQLVQGSERSELSAERSSSKEEPVSS
jgi:cell division protein FtsB